MRIGIKRVRVLNTLVYLVISSYWWVGRLWVVDPAPPPENCSFAKGRGVRSFVLLRKQRRQATFRWSWWRSAKPGREWNVALAFPEGGPVRLPMTPGTFSQSSGTSFRAFFCQKWLRTILSWEELCLSPECAPILASGHHRKPIGRILSFLRGSILPLSNLNLTILGLNFHHGMKQTIRTVAKFNFTW